MRPGNRWNGDAANPLAAAIGGALIALVVAYGLTFLFVFLGGGVVAGSSAHAGAAARLAALSLYAAQHVTLIGSGSIPDMGRIHATITFPLTLWAAIPAIGLLTGGFAAARGRVIVGRWSAVATALVVAVIYTVALAVASIWVNARFTSTVVPAIQGTEFNPPAIPFRPSLFGSILYSLLFGFVFTYLGSLLALRSGPRLGSTGKWWACTKAIVVVGLIIQMILAAALWGWFVFRGPAQESEDDPVAKFVQMLPTAAGIGYSLAYGAKLSYAAVPTDMPSASYSADVSLYRGITSHNGSETKKKRMGGYVIIAALIAALAAFLTGRLSVRWGSTDGSLPTAIRVLIIQSLYMTVLMGLCRMGWGIAGQFSLYLQPRFDLPMLVSGLAVLLLSLFGAHFAGRGNDVSLGGFPTV